MAFGSIELTTISRAQDYSTVKQNEDNKGMTDQANFSQQVQKNVEQRIQEVHSSDNAQWHRKNPDAKEKGKNEYHGDGGRGRKQQKKQAGTNGSASTIAPGGFDIKI